MSIFDVIRYPVTDITDQSIASVPVCILEPWVRFCAEIIEFKFNIDLESSMVCLVVHQMILWKAMKEFPDSMEGQMQSAEMWKYYFTMLLRQHIRDYES